ncbi:hypothetical protein SAMN05518668_103370 [Sphingobium sp. YR657]|uniref:Uncharacterized protein n=1 Tax=Sphingobium yanoikuyae ATCC 51230 TaxID=883163 RepID=K9CUR0_SPHYA|nr:hypothetical protein HMPREF9718_01065 [Sphingobium yanoikuyae ATCC 51230]SHL84020.1 hypothetical protein SAMN05518668_103370 [Sphingobium sp. YR657]
MTKNRSFAIFQTDSEASAYENEKASRRDSNGRLFLCLEQGSAQCAADVSTGPLGLGANQTITAAANSTNAEMKKT